MSDGVYVLRTRDGFRVAYSDNYDEFFGPFNDATMNFRTNGNKFLNVFGKSEVYPDEKSVLEAAFGISRVIDETDDGVMFIENYPNYTFEELTSGKAT